MQRTHAIGETSLGFSVRHLHQSAHYESRDYGKNDSKHERRNGATRRPNICTGA